MNPDLLFEAVWQLSQAPPWLRWLGWAWISAAVIVIAWLARQR